MMGGSSLSSLASPNNSTFSKTSSWSHVGHSVSARTWTEDQARDADAGSALRGGKSVVLFFFKCANLGHLTLCGEEDPGEGIGQTCAVGGKQAPSLVHVDPQLEDLFHCNPVQTSSSVISISGQKWKPDFWRNWSRGDAGSYSCRWGWWVVKMACRALWTTCFLQIHSEDHSDSLCVVCSVQATNRSRSWTGLSSLQVRNLSYQESSKNMK